MSIDIEKNPHFSRFKNQIIKAQDSIAVENLYDTKHIHVNIRRKGYPLR